MKMAIYGRTLIDIPEDKGVHVKSTGIKGEKYVYKYVKYFRNAEGKPRNKSKSIGKLDMETGKMYPNDNYFELYQVDPAMADVNVWDYGYSYLILEICKAMGLLDCLTQAFGTSYAMEVVIMAAYMIREGSAMDGLEDWQQRNYFPNHKRKLSSQATSKIFSSLTADQMNHFFTDWVKKNMSDGCGVCYDVTSISSYAKEMTSVEYGYNRDHEKLAQFNLGIFCDELTKTPLYYNRYNGSLTDKKNLSYVLANAKNVGINQVKIILDGGFCDKDCVTSLHDLCNAFTIGIPLSLKEAQRVFIAHKDQIQHYANELSQPYIHTYCVTEKIEFYGVAGRAFLYFDALNHVHLCGELSERIDRLKAELANLKRYPKSKLKRYSAYFKLIKHEHGSGFDYQVDVDKVEVARKNKGYFMIFSTDKQATPEDILYYYRQKDVAEKMFAQIKCEMEGNRIRTHNEQTTDGKVFVTFIACIMRSYLLNKLSKYMTDNTTTLKKVLNQLSDIRILSNFNGLRFTKALTKKQREILQSFDAYHDLADSLK
jgi:transposase